MKHLVYIDDEKELGTIFQDIYSEDESLKYKFFSDPIEALAFINENPIAGILCDYQMPKMTGFDLAKKVPAVIPFVLISGNLEVDISEHKNILCVLFKPIKLNEIKAVFERLKIT